MRSLVLATVLLALSVSAPEAAEPPKAPVPKLLLEGKAWSGYALTEKNGQICYLIGHPTKNEPASIKLESAEARITHRTADKKSNEVSFLAGAPFKEKSDVDLDIDGKKFKLFTDKDTAWAADAATDKAIADAMSKGKTLVVKGISARGTAMTETYGLAGLLAALKEIDKACGVKR